MQVFTKLLGIGMLALLVVGCAGTSTNADRVAKAAAEIADLDLPDGYTPDFVADLIAYTVVSYTPSNGHGHLYLIQSGDTSVGKSLDTVLNEMQPGAYNASSRMTVLETRPMTVRGQQTTLVISEGINGEGAVYRQAMVSFEGKGGPAMVIISDLIDDWSESTVESFLASLR